MITVLSGGTGGAKLVDGLAKVVSPASLTIIANTGDDLSWWGLPVSPDIDSIIYVLAGLLSKERGWGFQGDTFYCSQTMAKFGEDAWFKVGDCDLAMHLVRSRLRADGMTLSQATTEIASKLGVTSKILPMSDSKIETRVETEIGELSFEEYFVKRRYQDKVISVRFSGAEESDPAPGVLHAITSAVAVIIAPSNPVTSIGPILAIPKIRQALRDTQAEVIAVSPIVADAAVSGPAAQLMASQKLPVSVMGIAEAYGDFLDVLVIDNADAKSVSELERSGLRVLCTKAMMHQSSDRAQLAREVLSQIPVHAGIKPQ